MYKLCSSSLQYICTGFPEGVLRDVHRSTVVGPVFPVQGKIRKGGSNGGLPPCLFSGRKHSMAARAVLNGTGLGGANDTKLMVPDGSRPKGACPHDPAERYREAGWRDQFVLILLCKIFIHGDRPEWH